MLAELALLIPVRVASTMRMAALGAAIIVVAAAIIVFRESVSPVQPLGIVATIVLVLAVAIQRLNGIHRWLSAARERQKEHIAILAQQCLIDFCTGWRVSEPLLDVNVHVWAVPLWYRRAFPFGMRRYLKSKAGRQPVKFFTRWVIRPTFQRAAAVGLVKRAPSGVRFHKGYGLVGVCVANNDRSELLTLNTADPKYRRALKVETEAEWQKLPSELTHSISLKEANKLARSYGQIIARVVQDLESGEAIGCVTISLKEPLAQGHRLDREEGTRRGLTDLALSLADIL